MWPNTPPLTIRTPIHRIAIIKHIVHTQLALLLTWGAHKPTTARVPDANAKTVARGAATGCVRIVDARVALVAVFVIPAAAAADLVRIGRENRSGLGSRCPFGCGFLGGAHFGCEGFGGGWGAAILTTKSDVHYNTMVHSELDVPVAMPSCRTSSHTSRPRRSGSSSPRGKRERRRPRRIHTLPRSQVLAHELQSQALGCGLRIPWMGILANGA